MRQVTRFEAVDGKLFETQVDCEDYELSMYWLDRIREELGAHSTPEEIYEWVLVATKGFNDV